ncbi:ion transporter [Nocardioides sp. JQ2195]|nr:ion transporter [Nocardioides sp. JQ2195]
MLVLAIISVALLGWITFWEVDPDTERTVIIADYMICGIFAVEFVWRWRRAGEGWKFPLKYWYEVLGMIPVSNPAFRSFRLLRIFIVLARLGRAADRAFGDRVTAALVKQGAESIVEVIKRPVTIAVMDEVTAVLQTGNYTTNIARALNENRAELDAMIVELVKRDQQMGRLKFLPFHDDVVRLVSDTVFRLIFEVLNDPRTDELISDALRENIDQMRAAIRGKYDEEQAARAARSSR